MFDKEQLTLKSDIREMVEKEEQNIRFKSAATPVGDLIEQSRQILKHYLNDKVEEMKKIIQHYFQCADCKECSASVEHRNLLADNEKEFLDDVRMVGRGLQKEIEQRLMDLKLCMKTEKLINEMSTEMDGILKRKVKETISQLRPEELEKEKIEQIFNDL